MASTNNQPALSGSESGNATGVQVITRTAKGRDGWESSSDIELGGARLLRITTSKSSRGGISTNGTVFTIEEDAIRTELFGDFSKTLANDTAARCTEKSVVAQHKVVLESLEKIKADVAAFYLAKNPKPWVVVRNAGQDDEDIIDDFAKFGDAVACKNEQADECVDVMRRNSDGTLTTEY